MALRRKSDRNSKGKLKEIRKRSSKGIPLGKNATGIIVVGECAQTEDSKMVSVLLANYYAGFVKKKTAYISLASVNDYICIRDYYRCNETKGGFVLYDVMYSNGTGKSDIADLVSKGYDIIIINVGNKFLKYQDEIKRCSYRIVCGRINPFDNNSLCEFIKSHTDEKWTYLVECWESSSIRAFEREYTLTIHNFEYNINPFSIKADTINFIEDIMCCVD